MNEVTWALATIALMLAAIVVASIIDKSDSDTIWIDPDKLEEDDE